jgi:DNA-directed RNA polymerase specialized sigma24 family protein
VRIGVVPGGPAIGTNDADSGTLLSDLGKRGNSARAAISVLFERYAGRLWLTMKGVPRQEAEDIVSTIFERLLRAARGGVTVKAAPNHLGRAARNRC